MLIQGVIYVTVISEKYYCNKLDSFTLIGASTSSVVSPAPHGLDYAQINSLIATTLFKQQQDFVQHESDPHLYLEGALCSNVAQPCPGLSFHTHEDSNKKIKPDGCAKGMHPSNVMAENLSPLNIHQWFPSVTIAANGRREVKTHSNVKREEKCLAGGKEEENNKTPIKASDQHYSSPR